MVGELGQAGQEGPEERDAVVRQDGDVVAVCLLLVAHHGVNVGKVRLDVLRLKVRRFLHAPVHKDDVDDVVANVTLTLNLRNKTYSNTSSLYFKGFFTPHHTRRCARNRFMISSTRVAHFNFQYWHST